jgi:serine phosphatase RsbU (regulator of sigma subunit)
MLVLMPTSAHAPAITFLDAARAKAAEGDMETRARSRAAAVIGLLLSTVDVLSLVVMVRRQAAAVAAICAVGAAVHLTAALQAYRTGRNVVPGALIVLSVFVSMVFANAMHPLDPAGVFGSMTLVFFVILPLLTLHLLGTRSGIAVGVAAFAYFSGAFAWMALHPAGAADPDLTVKYAVTELGIVVSVAVGLLYTRARNRMVGELQAAHTALDALRVAEQRRLKAEVELATRIQTALLPRDLGVEGLEIAATILPAAEVGGDYYDILPIEGGAWLCIGDVAGRGLNAGLTMLMIQSAVSALAQKHPTPSPGRVLCALNTTLYQNVRQRMGRDDHATATLLRYHRDGTVCFAGAHEEILVLRAAEGRCQAIPTPGPWVGASSSIAAHVTHSRLTLSDGDLLVLYTDGLTEARGGGQRQFGLERVEAEILRARGEPVEAIREAILAALHAFSPVLADDVALVVARYRAPASACRG